MLSGHEPCFKVGWLHPPSPDPCPGAPPCPPRPAFPPPAHVSRRFPTLASPSPAQPRARYSPSRRPPPSPPRVNPTSPSGNPAGIPYLALPASHSTTPGRAAGTTSPQSGSSPPAPTKIRAGTKIRGGDVPVGAVRLHAGGLDSGGDVLPEAAGRPVCAAGHRLPPLCPALRLQHPLRDLLGGASFQPHRRRGLLRRRSAGVTSPSLFAVALRFQAQVGSAGRAGEGSGDSGVFSDCWVRIVIAGPMYQTRGRVHSCT
ncbi:hypothetical protein GQ55_3G350300 [Panicum hallii var. hallii]|uniref:Uncharacterized protein n=1 Tax=Panicum hallii var. hallii TaxID=1504633 RepID=A0A2T7EFT6_9POAL|nr:hypothetical protein GQ55_3G350300 [Panicum hallii var. hallii]